LFAVRVVLNTAKKRTTMSQETIIELSKTIAALSEENERWKAHSKAQDDHYAAGVKALQAESDGYFTQRNTALAKLQEAQDTIGGLRKDISALSANRDRLLVEMDKMKSESEAILNICASIARSLESFKTVRFPKYRGKGLIVEIETTDGSKRRFTFLDSTNRARAILLAHQTIYRDEAKVGGGSF
jgi:uncharacterized small protein (DUF1192 family)